MTYTPYRPSKTHMLDMRRTEEKVVVNLGGDARRLLSINRGCLLMNTAEQITAIAARLADGADVQSGEVVATINRFAEPALTGYRDFKAFIRARSNGHISTLRVVHAGYENTTFTDAAVPTWALRQIATQVALGDTSREGPIVIVSDNFLRDDEHSLTAVHGFAHETLAWQYAISRFKDGIRVLVDDDVLSTQDLKYSWLVYGEDVAVLSGDRIHCLGPDLMAYILRVRIPDVPYWDIERDFALSKTGVELLDPRERKSS